MRFQNLKIYTRVMMKLLKCPSQLVIFVNIDVPNTRFALTLLRRLIPPYFAANLVMYARILIQLISIHVCHPSRFLFHTLHFHFHFHFMWNSVSFPPSPHVFVLTTEFNMVLFLYIEVKYSTIQTVEHLHFVQETTIIDCTGLMKAQCIRIDRKKIIIFVNNCCKLKKTHVDC